MALLSLSWVTGLLAKPMGQYPSINVTEDEFEWYTPVAVILKPASNKDLQTRLLDDVKNQPFPSSVWPPVRDTWPFDPWAPYDGDRNINVRQDSDDSLREFYETYHLPSRVQGNLLSLARMGLVAIPRKEIRHDVGGDTQSGNLFSEL